MVINQWGYGGKVAMVTIRRRPWTIVHWSCLIMWLLTVFEVELFVECVGGNEGIVDDNFSKDSSDESLNFGMKYINENMMKAMICVYTSLLTKQLTLQNNCILCSFYKLNDFVINWTHDLNNYLLIPCLDSRRAYGSTKIYSKFGGGKSIRMKRKRLSISTHNK